MSAYDNAVQDAKFYLERGIDFDAEALSVRNHGLSLREAELAIAQAQAALVAAPPTTVPSPAQTPEELELARKQFDEDFPELALPATVAAPTAPVRMYEGFLAVAIRAHGRKQRVLPIEVGAKNPTMKWKNTAIDTDSTEQWAMHSEQWIQECAAKFADAAVCVLAKPYEFCFIDEDASDDFRKGYEGFAGEPFPNTFTTQSRPNHRQSHWLQTDETRKLGNIPQVDELVFSFRQNNLYVLSEGSPHPKGGFYDVVDSTPAVPMPYKLVEYMRLLKNQTQASKSEQKMQTPRTPQANDFIGSERPRLHDGVVYSTGGRNNRLSQYLYHRWVLECCTEAELRADADIFNETKLNPPLAAAEVEQILAGKLGLEQIGTGIRSGGKVIPQPNPDEPKNLVDDGQPEDVDTSLQDKINQLLAEGKTNSEIAELSGFNELVREALDKVVKESKDIVETWGKEFRAVGELEQGSIVMLIDGFLPEGTTFIGANPSHGKTLVALAIAKAISTGTPLFNRVEFSVKKTYPCIYLIPETNDRAFRTRCEAFGIPNDRAKFLCRTISMGASLALSDPKLLEGIRQTKAVVFLDTASRFMTATDENSAAQNRQLVNDILTLRAAGAIAVIVLHHSRKDSGEKKEAMTLENMLRGTSDIGAMCDTAYGIRRDDALYNNGAGVLEIDVANIKPRDLINPPAPFRLAATYKKEGHAFPVSWIDETGNFQAVGFAETAKRNASKLVNLVKTNPEMTVTDLIEETGIKKHTIQQTLRGLGWHRVKGGSNGSSPWHQDANGECPYERKPSKKQGNNR